MALPNTSAGTAPHSFSFTNVAIYTTNDDGSVNLSTAAKLAKTQNGEQIYYVTSDIGARAAFADDVVLGVDGSVHVAVGAGVVVDLIVSVDGTTTRASP